MSACVPKIARDDPLHKRITIFLWLCLFVYTCLPLLTNKLFDAHDISYHLNRIEGMAAALGNGQFPVRMHPNILNDYGYPNSIFYPELFLYLPAALRAVGVNVNICYKVLLGIINALCVSLSLFSFRRIFRSRYAAYTGTVLYSLSLYRLLCIYVRGAVAEALAMSFLPLAALGIYEIFIRDSGKWYYLAIAFACVLQSHIITAELLLYVCIITAIVCVKRLFSKKCRRLLAALKAASAVLLLNLWFLVPFFDFERIGVKITSTDVSFWRNTINPPSKIFAIIFPVSRLLGTVDNMPYTIGFSLFMLLTAFAVLLLLKRCGAGSGRISGGSGASASGGVRSGFYRSCREKKMFYIGGHGLIAAAVCMFMSTCLFPWYVFRFIPVLNRIASSMQFPWRLLSIGSLSACITATAFCMILKSDRRVSGKVLFVTVSAASLICANILIDSVLMYMPYFGNSARFNVTAPVDDPAWVYDGQYSLKSTDIDLLAVRGETAVASNENMRLYDIVRSKGTLSVNFSVENSGAGAGTGTSDYIELPVSWYPHYVSRIDGEIVPNDPGENNVIRVYTEGRSSGCVTVRWESPAIYRICEIMSLLSLILLSVYIVTKRAKVRK